MKEKFKKVCIGRYSSNQIHQSHLITPKTLFLIRLFNFLYTLAIWIGSVIEFTLSEVGVIDGVETDGGAEFMWFTFTHLSYSGLLLYLMLALLLTYHFRYRVKQDSETLTLSKSWAEWTLLYLYTTVANNHLIVTIVYWLFLSSNFSTYSFTSQWFSISRHGGNLITFILEFILGCMSPTWGTCLLQILTMVLYLCWAWLYYGISRVWVYSFLDWNDRSAVVFYVGLTVAVILVAVGSVYAHRLRDHLFIPYAPNRPDKPITAVRCEKE